MSLPDALKPASNAKTIDDLWRRMKAREPTAFLRFGDGEVYLMDDSEPELSRFQKTIRRKNNWSPPMSWEMREAWTMRDPAWMVAHNGGVGIFPPYEDDLETLLQRYPREDAYHASCWFLGDDGPTTAESPGLCYDPPRFGRFLRECVHGRDVLLITRQESCRCDLIRAALDVQDAVEFPSYDKDPRDPREAYPRLDEFMPEVLAKAGKAGLVCLGIGITSNILAKRLWQAGVRVDMLDIGSPLDLWYGSQPTRQWMPREGEFSRLHAAYLHEFGLGGEPLAAPVAADPARNRIDVIVVTCGPDLGTFARNLVPSIKAHLDNYRLLWIDNASDPAAYNAAERAVKGMPCDAVQIASNVGCAKARNVGLSMSTAPYVLILDSDTQLYPSTVPPLMAACRDGYGLAGCLSTSGWQQPAEFRKQYPQIGNAAETNQTDAKRAEWLAESCRGMVVDPPHPFAFFCVMLTRDAIREVGYFDERFGQVLGEDYDWHITATERGIRAGLCLDSFCWHQHRTCTAGVMGGRERWEAKMRANQELIRAKHPNWKG